MKIILFLFLSLSLIKIYISLIPIWNLDKVGVNLFENSSEFTYSIVDKELHDDIRFKLTKKIIKEWNRVRITKIFELKEKDVTKISSQEVLWEDIESAYTDKNGYYFVCPKGKFHMYIYYQGNKNEFIPPEFNDDGKDWELKCYYQNSIRQLFISYLHNDNPFYQYSLNYKEIKYYQKINKGVLDYKWTTNNVNN